MVLFATSALGQAFDFRRIDDSALLAALRHVALLGFLRADGTEVAAFIVQENDGITCLLWPHTALVREARYEGKVPPGTVAIVHSHPRTLPEPSRGDVAQAMRIKLPMYVVTRWDLAAIDPSSGERIKLIRGKDWTRGGELSACRADWSLSAEAQRVAASTSLAVRLIGTPDRR